MSSSSHILSLSELADRTKRLRAEGKRIVLCHGVFDLLHIGHIRYLRGAGALGDVLVVTITPDCYVDKGPHRPAFGEQLRAEAVASLGCVDFVAINLWPTAEETLRLLLPHVYAKGAEFKNLDDATGKIACEAAVAKEMGIEIAFIEDIVFSSSALINRHLSSFSKDCQEYMDLFRSRHSVEEIISYFESFSNLTVLVVGDTILDEYVYCTALGSSSKDPVLALHYQSKDIFAGGAVAVANHVAQHVHKVIFCTVLGDDGKAHFIQKNLAENVEMHFIVRPHAPTVRKSRVLDGYSFQKQIEVYEMDRRPLDNDVDESFLDLVHQTVKDVDMVFAADFGHSCISEAQVKNICKNAPFLAVNTQANAGNRGYHTIGRYPRADFVSLATHEMSLQYRNCTLSNLDMMMDLQAKMNTRYIVVTEGRCGCAVLSASDFIRAPSFASHVVDRVGAGDALFAITALAAYKGISAEIIAFLGNIAGSLAVETIGNAKAVGREAMRRYIFSVMK